MQILRLTRKFSTVLEDIKLEEDEPMVFLYAKSLYNNETVEEAIKKAIKELYSSQEVSKISRSAIKIFLRLALMNVHFNCKKMCYTQSDV